MNCRSLLSLVLVMAFVVVTSGCRTFSSGFPFMKKEQPEIVEVATDEIPPGGPYRPKPQSTGDEMSTMAAAARKNETLAAQGHSSAKSTKEKKAWYESGDSTLLMSRRSKEIYQNLER